MRRFGRGNVFKLVDGKWQEWNIFPEYYLINVESFEDVIASDLDEWIVPKPVLGWSRWSPKTCFGLHYRPKTCFGTPPPRHDHKLDGVAHKVYNNQLESNEEEMLI